MVTAPDALLLNDAELQRCSSMCALAVQHADMAASVAERDEFLVQYLDRLRHISEFLREADRLPITAHVLAQWRARTALQEFQVIRRRFCDLAGHIRSKARPFAGRAKPLGLQLLLASLLLGFS